MPVFLKKTSGKSLYYLLILVSLVANSYGVYAQIPDFSGNWIINKEKTDFGKFPQYTSPYVLNISQHSDSISIERLSKNREGNDKSYVEKLPFNGTIVESMVKSTKKRASIRWLEEKHILTENAIYKDYSFNKTYSATEIWELSTSGKILTISRKDEGDDGDDSSRLVYTKQ